MRKTALCKCENKGLTNIRAKIWAYTWVSEKFGHSNAKTQKTGRAIHILSLLKKRGGGIHGGAEKGGYSGAHPYYVIHRELPPENVVRGDQKLCKRSLTNPP